MKNIFKPGDQKVFKRTVTASDTASFDSGTVHPVYATFALARDAEWCCRLFVLEIKDDDEEGIGTMVSVNHLSSALINQEVIIIATVKLILNNQIICTYTAYVNEREIANGEQAQKILKKEKLEKIFNAL
ncbi:MAG: hypothetical protein LH629_00315 [Ignavibacteria bacterium]|nr:hypothetical protein [Ignavibacteria bacterium]